MKISKDRIADYPTIVIAASQYDPTPLYVAVAVSGGKGGGNKNQNQQGKKKGGGGGKWKIIKYNEDYLRLGKNKESEEDLVRKTLLKKQRRTQVVSVGVNITLSNYGQQHN